MSTLTLTTTLEVLKMNTDVREAIKRANLKQWQIADYCGVSESTLIRWLRFELSEEHRKLIYQAIESLSKAA